METGGRSAGLRVCGPVGLPLLLCISALILVSLPAAEAAAPRFRLPRQEVEGFPPPRQDIAKVAIGERLFLETRFAQFFFAHANGDANALLTNGDPAVATSVTTTQPLPGPFAGFSMNCRACHLVAEQRAAGRGHRTYADFARRSPVPARSDGRTFTARNSPAMVNASIPRETPFFLHFDGEFTSLEALIKGTLTGRNLGWLPDERAQAVRHIARVIRDDNGQGPLAREFGGHSYRHIFAGTDESLGDEGERFRLPEDYRLNIATASDNQILDAIARLIGAYSESLFFSRDEANEYDASPYDAFAETNQIPRRVSPGQSVHYYNRHVSDLAANLKEPTYVIGTNNLAPPAPGRFKTLAQEFRFGPEELAGMRIFFALARHTPNAPARKGRTGNCAACHHAPDFTDHGFHNTGATQEEYDALHGAGAFLRLAIPSLAERRARPEAFLPPSAAHPHARGPFLDIPATERPGSTDLGLWNVFANPDQPQAQERIRTLLNGEARPAPDEVLLPRTIALFKTPGLRGLAFSAPYLHNGSKDTLEDVIRFYIKTSAQARAGTLRNADPALAGISLTEDDIAPLAAFLRALNEDYD